MPITSYQIDYDRGLGSEEWESLKGFSSNDLTLSVTKTDLTLNQAYRFRYRAKNIYGWGDYSDEATLYPNQRPG